MRFMFIREHFVTTERQKQTTDQDQKQNPPDRELISIEPEDQRDNSYDRADD